MATARFDELADDLYAVPPDEFIAARDEQVRTARAAGDRDVAKSLQQLRKPTQSAWVVNQLSRQAQAPLARLLDLGRDLREATQEMSGDDLRRLSSRRQELVGELVDRARRITKDAGLRIDAGLLAEVEATLTAAVADADVAAQVRSGRLVKPAEYSGFGPPVAGPPRRDREQERGRRAKPAGARDDNAAAKRRAQQERELADAYRRAADLQARLDELTEETRRVEKDLAAARRDVERRERALRGHR